MHQHQHDCVVRKMKNFCGNKWGAGSWSTGFARGPPAAVALILSFLIFRQEVVLILYLQPTSPEVREGGNSPSAIKKYGEDPPTTLVSGSDPLWNRISDIVDEFMFS